MNTIGHPFIELLSVDSTNNYAMGMVHAGMAQHGTAVFAHEQTAGKGQRQKQWLAQKGANIILSAVLEPRGLAPSQAFIFSMAMAAGIHRFFEKYAGAETKIKWPNDLYWRDRKAGGILTENIFSGHQWKYAVVGIGININQTRFEGLEHAVSLRQITGKEYPTITLAKELCAALQKAFENLLPHEGAVIKAYHDCLYKKDEMVKLKKGSRVFSTCIKGVAANGDLVTESGAEERFAIGDVAWVIQ